LRNYCDNYVSCPDYAAAQGMRVLASPMKEDARITSGESGAAGFGFVYEVLTNKALADWKKKLKIDENSILLFFSTEGDTDQENYKKIVWDGRYQRPEQV